MSTKSFYEMKPDEIIKARDDSGCAFIPVGPIEWHSYHLPMGTDALIAEGISMLVAEKIGGVYFKPLLLGVDVFRNDEELIQLGFRKNEKIFGMNYPELPLVSEYCTKKDLITIVRNRLTFLKECGFKVTFVVNHHGGLGQNDSLKEVCDSFKTHKFSAEFVNSFKYCFQYYPLFFCQAYHSFNPSHITCKSYGYVILEWYSFQMKYGPDLG